MRVKEAAVPDRYRASAGTDAEHVLEKGTLIVYIFLNYLHGAVMAIHVNNPEADALTRKFAQMTGVGITDAIVIAMREAIERRSRAETPFETAARIRAKHQVVLGGHAHNTLPREAFDAMWDDR
jgi:antitoxin VapB